LNKALASHIMKYRSSEHDNLLGEAPMEIDAAAQKNREIPMGQQI
jgi:hypothetical protein